MSSKTNHSFPSKYILNGMTEIAYVFNENGKLLLWNSKLESVLGYSHDELYLSHHTDFIDPAFEQQVIEAVDRVLTDNIEEAVEYLLVSKSGKKTPYIGSGKLMEFDGQKYLIGQAINISRLKKTEQELIHRLEEIKELKTELEKENTYLREQVVIANEFEGIIGESDKFKITVQRIKQASTTRCTVLLNGENGTGKSLFAHTIHNYGPVKSAPFVKVNCATLVNQKVIESVFFSAKNGTIFLEHIHELNPTIQADLMHFLEKEKLDKNGAKYSLYGARIIASTQENLEHLVEKQLFRKDLFFFLSVFQIHIPALRDRIGDIPALTAHMVKKFNAKHGKNVSKITIATMHRLQEYRWPGNIKELENVIEHAIIISTRIKLIVEHLKAPKFASTNYLTLAENEKIHINKTLKLTNGRIDGPKGAALILGIHPETLRSRMRKLGINRVYT